MLTLIGFGATLALLRLHSQFVLGMAFFVVGFFMLRQTFVRYFTTSVYY
jgi:hypothetical protein